MENRKLTSLFVLLALVMGCVWAASTPVFAATFTVTTAADTGAGSLREAIATANSTAGTDTINFSSLFDSAQ